MRSHKCYAHACISPFFFYIRCDKRNLTFVDIQYHLACINLKQKNVYSIIKHILEHVY